MIRTCLYVVLIALNVVLFTVTSNVWVFLGAVALTILLTVVCLVLVVPATIRDWRRFRKAMDHAVRSTIPAESAETAIRLQHPRLPHAKVDKLVKRGLYKARLRANKQRARDRRALRDVDRIHNDMYDYLKASQATMQAMGYSATTEQVIKFAAQWRWADTLAAKGKRPPEVF